MPSMLPSARWSLLSLVSLYVREINVDVIIIFGQIVSKR